MADYYPLIARAIAGLDPSAPGESRRALYERARTALIAQLRSVQPPLSESEITRERLSLEEAVRKVESEAAQRAREASRPGGGAAPRGGDAFRRANARPPDGRSQPRPRPRRRSAPSASARSAAVARCASAARPGRAAPAAQLRARTRRRRAAAPAAAADSDAGCRSCRRPASGQARRAAVPTMARPQTPPAPGMRGFRDIAADADDLGRAAAQANRARERPMPTCRRPRRNSTGSSRAWRTAAPIPTRPIPTRSRSRRPSATRRSRRKCRRRAAFAASAGSRPRTEEALARDGRCFRSRARSRSASC